MKCPRKDCKNEAVSHQLFGVLPCGSCQNKNSRVVPPPEFANISKSDRITEQRDHHDKDLLQPWEANKPNPEFVKAYPEYRNSYFTPEQLKDII